MLVQGMRKKRKMAQFKRATDAALWFGEYSGLIPNKGVDNRGAEGAKAPPDF